MNLGLPSHEVLEFEKKTKTLFLLQHMHKNGASVFSRCLNAGFSGRFLDASV